MKTVDGRQWASREDLIEHSGYSRRTLHSLWRDRQANGHPAARRIDGVMHWDLQLWDEWLTRHHDRPRDLSGVDRSGDPDEQLPPAGQARLLGVDPSRISQYAKNPPPGWPAPVHVEELPTRTREFRTRAQLWAWVDNPLSGFGARAGRPPGGPRVRVAAQALAELPERKTAEVAAVLAERHGQSVSTWERIVAQACKNAQR